MMGGSNWNFTVNDSWLLGVKVKMAKVINGKVVYDLDSVAKNRDFDQSSITRKYSTAAAGFGMCKALCVQWLKRGFLDEDFWSWLPANHDTIMLMSRDEVVDVSAITSLTAAHGLGNPQVAAYVEAKKNWHTRFLSTSGLAAREVVASTPMNAGNMANDIAAQSGYILLYICDSKQAGHCLGCYIDQHQYSWIFDPNFGEFIIPGGYSSFELFCKDLYADYYLLFRLNKAVGDFSHYRIESLSRKAG